MKVMIVTIIVMVMKQTVFGVFFREVQTDGLPGIKPGTVIMSKTFHECGMERTCRYVTKNLETNVYRKYKSIENIPQSGENLSIWQKVNKKGDFKNCKEALDNGITVNATIEIPWGNGSHFQAPCDMTTDGGGWTIIQRRLYGNVSFMRNWDEYAKGFGEINGDFWLGLRAMRQFTKRSYKTLRFDLQNIQLHQGYAKYSRFVINSEAESFSISLGDYVGNIGDAMAEVNGSKFSTADRDNDSYDKNCAEVFKGPWWYNSCSFARLNSLFSTTSSINSVDPTDVMKWQSWENSNTTIIRSEIKLR